ncbi:MAG: AAA family ATPase [Blastochloris sp.]|nr:AAA family ATPase [Blastochloris sp.]
MHQRLPPISLFQALKKPRLRLFLRMHRIRKSTKSVLGIKPRTLPLIIGPSGCGKTAVIKLLAESLNLPWRCFPAPSWIVNGASTRPCTLEAIHYFVSHHPECIIFLDEIDKSCPQGDQLFASSWSLSVFTEILALLDGDNRLLGINWQRSSLNKLRSGKVYLIGAGSWQRLRDAQPKSSYPGREQMQVDEPSINSERGIPTELAYRFSHQHIKISYPQPSDFASAITKIRQKLHLDELDSLELQLITEEAVTSSLGVRWLENYLTDVMPTDCKYLVKLRSRSGCARLQN